MSNIPPFTLPPLSAYGPTTPAALGMGTPFGVSNYLAGGNLPGGLPSIANQLATPTLTAANQMAGITDLAPGTGIMEGGLNFSSARPMALGRLGTSIAGIGLPIAGSLIAGALPQSSERARAAAQWAGLAGGAGSIMGIPGMAFGAGAGALRGAITGKAPGEKPSNWLDVLVGAPIDLLSIFGGERKPAEAAGGADKTTILDTYDRVLGGLGADDDFIARAKSTFELSRQMNPDITDEELPALASQVLQSMVTQFSVEQERKSAESNVAAVQAWMEPFMQQQLGQAQWYADQYAAAGQASASEIQNPGLRSAVSALASAYSAEQARNNSLAAQQMAMYPEAFLNQVTSAYEGQIAQLQAQIDAGALGGQLYAQAPMPQQALGMYTEAGGPPPQPPYNPLPVAYNPPSPNPIPGVSTTPSGQLTGPSQPIPTGTTTTMPTSPPASESSLVANSNFNAIVAQLTPLAASGQSVTDLAAAAQAAGLDPQMAMVAVAQAMEASHSYAAPQPPGIPVTGTTVPR